MSSCGRPKWKPPPCSGLGVSGLGLCAAPLSWAEFDRIWENTRAILDIKTVKKQIESARHKLNAVTTIQAVSTALVYGLITP